MITAEQARELNPKGRIEEYKSFFEKKIREARNECALTERLCDEDGDRLDTPFAVIQKQEEHFELLAAACDIREAIDAAIRHCTVKEQGCAFLH